MSVNHVLGHRECDGLRWIRSKQQPWKESLRKIRICISVRATVRRTGCRDNGVDLLRAETKLLKSGLQKCLTLLIIGACECERRRRAAPHRRIERVNAIRAHHNNRRQVAGGEIVHTANKRIHTRAILVVHLR
jgi:hypothetical protein